MVFLFILLIFFILIIVIMTSKIEIKIENLIITSQTKKHINDKYKIIIKMYVFNKIPIIKITLTENKLGKIYTKLKMKEKIRKLEEEIYINKDKFDLKLLNAIREFNKCIKIVDLKLKIQLGTENAFLTSILVAIISSIMSITISKKAMREDKIFYNVEPIYNSQNLINIAISGIFQIKMIHIINTIYVLNKKGGIEYERTSNRRSYDYSYE